MTRQKDSIGILFLGGAKRVSMAMHFIEAAKRLGLRTRLYSYELEKTVPIASVAEIIIGKRWKDSDIIPHLQQTVARYDIDMMIPFVDGAVEVVAKYPGNECYAPVCSPILATLMFDKTLAAEMFEREQIPTPRTYTRGAPRFPLIAKPRQGSASRGIKIINSSAEFRAVDPASYLIQEYIECKREYTVDCFVTRSGDIMAIVPRERLETAGGEVTRTVTVERDDIIVLSRHAIESLRLTGAITLQFLEDTETGSIMLMEINPRLGGGAITAIAAGADIPSMILCEATGRQIIPASDWKPGTLVARYLQETVFHV